MAKIHELTLDKPIIKTQTHSSENKYALKAHFKRKKRRESRDREGREGKINELI